MRRRWRRSGNDARTSMSLARLRRYAGTHRYVHSAVMLLNRNDRQSQDGSLAEHHTVRGVKTYPTLKLSQVPRILRILELAETDDVEIYDLHGRYWSRQCVADAINLKRHSVLVLRSIGVRECVYIDA